MHRLRLAPILFLAAVPARASHCEPELFRIARSTNANVVVYLLEGLDLGTGEPVRELVPGR